MDITNNLFLEFQKKKQQVCGLAEAALKAGWLDETTYNEILSKIKEDVLTIGVIGQMKCGKSTFLNSFLFGKPFLPAATTPMTAALSVITYGEQEGVIAEFYSEEEWEQLKYLAQCDEDKDDENKERDLQTKSSIKAAKELYEKSGPIRSQLSSLLGKTQKDNFNNLIEYVGADGKYVSIVKSVKIFLNEEWLKGVEIVDTPGFNDPVVSREERTKEFLKRADVVLMMLYAGRAFDATDRDILFDKVRKVGVGKIIIAVNKYDIQLVQGESPEQIKGFVTDEIQKALRQYKEESLSELLRDLDPILISAQLALLSKMPLQEIRKDPDLKHHYDKACDDFELSSQSQLYTLSKVKDLEDKVREIISTQKEAILIRKPINMIFQKANNEKDIIKEELLRLNQSKEALSIPDDELEERIENLHKAYKRVTRKIEYAETDLSEAFDEISDKLIRELEDAADETKAECNRIIETYKKDTLSRKLNDRLELFKEREWPRKLKDAEKKLQRSLTENLNQLSDDIYDILNRYMDESDDMVEQFVRTLKRGMDSIHVNGTEIEEKASSEDNWSPWFVLLLPLAIPGYLLFETGRDEAREHLRNVFSSINWHDVEESFRKKKNNFISELGGENVKNLLKDLADQAEAARGSKEEKEQKLTQVIMGIEQKEAMMKRINDDYERLKKMINLRHEDI